jgi:hypothetical protein
MVLAQTLDNIKTRAAYREVSDGVLDTDVATLTLDIHSARLVIWSVGLRSGRRGKLTQNYNGTQFSFCVTPEGHVQ